MSLLEVQVASLCLLLVGTFICGTLPVVFIRCSSGNYRGRGGGAGSTGSRLASFLIYFGGGVLLSTALLHLLPEAREQFEREDSSQLIGSTLNKTHDENTGHKHHHYNSNVTSHHNHSIPLPEFTVLCGFFITYLVEIFLHYLLDRPKSSPDPHSTFRARFCSCSQRNIECSRPFKHKNPTPHPAALSERRRRSATWDGPTMATKRQEEKSQVLSPPDILQSSFITHAHPNYGAVTPSDGHCRLIHGEGGIVVATRAVAVPPHLPNIPEGAMTIPVVQKTASLSVASLLTVAALSFHSVFEGLAVGFQQSVTGTWTMLLAIALHKFVIAFVIGVEAVADESKTGLVIVCMAIFASMSPAGMAIAMLAGIGEGHVPGIAIGVLNCIATGTLLYVIFFEIWPRKSKDGLCTHRRFSAMAIGTALMAAVQYATTLL